ncbi:MAG: high-potential iron-sulfur protein [Rubrivivax sp.]
MSDALAPPGAPPNAASAPTSVVSTAMVTPQDPGAVALGYVAVASKADAGKYDKYAPGQDCGNCALYQGKPGDASGPCPLFGGRHVAAAGWCSAYVKKA